MDIRKVKKLIELLEESGIAEIEIKEGEESVRISRNGAQAATGARYAQPQYAPQYPPQYAPQYAPPPAAAPAAAISVMPIAACAGPATSAASIAAHITTPARRPRPLVTRFVVIVRLLVEGPCPR